MPTKGDVGRALVSMGFRTDSISRAIKLYETKYGYSYNIKKIQEIMSQLDNTTEDEQKSSKPQTKELSIKIKADGKIDSKDITLNFDIKSVYRNKETIGDILDKIEKYIQAECHPVNVSIWMIEGYPLINYGRKSFMDTTYHPRSYNKTPITKYKKEDIIKIGLYVHFKVNYEHKITALSITCKHMNKLNSNNPLHCPIYYSMKQEYQYNEENLRHLTDYLHFVNEMEEKPECKFKDECKAYQRQENGEGNRIDDKCHMKLYKHPPRSRQIKLAQNVHSMIINKTQQDNHAIYEPTDVEKKKYGYTEDDGWLKVLIEEVIKNGYKSDLCLECTKDDDCKHDDYSILQIVNDKMKSNRHKMMDSPLNQAEMLSLILYTGFVLCFYCGYLSFDGQYEIYEYLGCDCNYDLCKSQRDGNFVKWKWFDLCLYGAIQKLSSRESGKFGVFSGLGGVQLDSKKIKCAYFKTYTSTSWSKKVAKDFMGGDKGMILEIDSNYKDYDDVFCCDVSWISKFPDECEVLFARSISQNLHQSARGADRFKCSVIDESSGVQTVFLKKW